MADFIALRKGRNALSTVLHIFLNIALAVISTALTVISGLGFWRAFGASI